MMVNKNDINKPYNSSEYSEMINRLKKHEYNSIHCCKNITFQVTEDCNLGCTYCYQINKSHNKMTFEVAKKCIDSLFEDEKLKEYIHFDEIYTIILDFIGGEPFLEVELMDKIVEYFIYQSINHNKPTWASMFMISISTNGTLYFNENVQKFLKKYKDKISLGITIDGNKEMHDKCRIFKDTKKGSYDIVSEAIKDWITKVPSIESKITISPFNITKIYSAITYLFKEFDYQTVNANCVFEEGWNTSHAIIYYDQLKKIADWILDNDLELKKNTSLFNAFKYEPMNHDNNQNWCGGSGIMLAFDYKGDAFPCLRFMKSSLGDKVKPITLGSVYDGILKTKDIIDEIHDLESITRRSQSTDECFNCPIAEGCAWCTAYNYQATGSYNKRATYICIMHKAQSLANAYFFNKAYRKHNLKDRKKIYCPDEWALEIISNDELNMLKELAKED